MLAPLLERRGLLIILLVLLVQIVVLSSCLFVVVCAQLRTTVLHVSIQVHLLIILVIDLYFIQGMLVHLLLDIVCVSEHYFTKSRLCVYICLYVPSIILVVLSNVIIQPF